MSLQVCSHLRAGVCSTDRDWLHTVEPQARMNRPARNAQPDAGNVQRFQRTQGDADLTSSEDDADDQEDGELLTEADEGRDGGARFLRFVSTLNLFKPCY